MAEEELLTPEDPQESPLEQKYGSLIQKEKATAPMRVGFEAAKDIKPPAGEIIQLSKKTGLDRDSIKDDFDSVKKTAAQPTDKEYQQLLEKAPKVSKWLEDPYNAKATENDRPKLQKLEQDLSQSDPLMRVQPDEEVVRRAEQAALRRYEDIIAEEGVTTYHEGSVQPGIKRTDAEKEKLKLRLITEEITKRREQEKFIANPEKIGAKETFLQNPVGALPLFGGIASAIAADEKAMRTARMSPEDQDILLQEKRLQAAEARRGTTWPAKFAQMGMGLTAFGGELAMAPEMGAARGVTWLARLFPKLASGLLTQAPHIAANTTTFGTPETTVTQDKDGELQLQVASGGQTYAVPFAKAMASSLIDVGSAELPFHPLYKLWAGKVANPTVEGFVKAYTKGGIEAALGGIAINDAAKLTKELVGVGGDVEMPDTIKAIMGDSEALQRVTAMGAASAIAGGVGTAIQRQSQKADHLEGQAISYKGWFKDMAANVKEMEAHGKHPEVVADSIKEMVKGTDREFTQVPAEVFHDHYQKLGINADEFAAELTGDPDALAKARKLGPGGTIQVPTDQYLTKIGATDAGPVFEKAGANFDPNVPSVDAVKERIKEIKKLQESKEKQPATPEEAKLEEQVKALGESFRERAKEQGVDLAKFVEKGDTVKAKKVVERLTKATESVDVAQEDLGQSTPLLREMMGPKEAEKYGQLIKESKRAAYLNIDEQALADLNKERKQNYSFQEQQVRDNLSKELDQKPEYRILSIMETGLDVDGTIIHEGGIKLDREAIRELHGKEVLEALPKKILAPTKEAGNHPDDVAQMLGYSSGDELILKLWNLEPKEKVIDRRANEIMQKFHLEELAELPEKAKEAIHNDKEAQVKAYALKWLLENKFPQMKALIKRLGSTKAYVEEIQKQALADIAADNDLKNDPRRYERAERDANRGARDAILSGDLEGAVPLMELEIYNHEMYRASVAARKDARRIREYAAEFATSDKRKLLYAAGERYLAQGDGLLDRFSFKKNSEAKLKALESLKDFAETEANEGYISQIPEKLLNEAYRKNWREVPIEDLRAIETTLKQLENNAKLKVSLLEGNVLKSLNASASDLAGAIRGNKRPLYRESAEAWKEYGKRNGWDEAKIEAERAKAKATPLDSYTDQENADRNKRDLWYSPRNDASIYREIDGFKDGGIAQQLISRRMNESGAREAALQEKATLALDSAYGKFSNLERLQMHRQKFIPEIGGSLTTWQRMEIAALVKQEGARQRLRDGNGWGDVQLEAITKDLTARQKAWGDEVIALLESYAPDVKAQIERRTGLPAEMVKDYFPFKYDTRTDIKGAEQLDIQEAKMSMQAAGVQAQTKHGYTNTRLEEVKGKRLRFDSGVLFEHIREVTHDIAWSETLRDLSALLKHREVVSAFKDTYGDQVYRQLTKSLHDIAVGDKPAATAYEKLMNWLRHGSTISGLGWSFMQGATDPTGLSQGAQRVGPKWMAVGAKKVLGDAVHMENAVREMWDASEVMRLRGKTSMRELYESKSKIEQKSKAAILADFGLNAATAGKLDVKDITDSYYSIMTKVQIAQEAPLWWGALEKAKSEKPLAPDATPEQTKATRETWKSMADQAVLDAYGGGQIKDLPPLLKGDAAKKMLFGTFYSFANRTFNLMVESGIRYGRAPKTVASFGRLLSDYFLLYAIPAAVTISIKSLLTQNDKDFGKRLAQAELGAVVGSIPYVREAESFVQGRDYSGPAGMRFFSAMGGIGKNLFQGKADWHDMNTAAGIVFHYPALFVQRFVDGMESWLDIGNGTPLSPFFGPPPKRR